MFTQGFEPNKLSAKKNLNIFQPTRLLAYLPLDDGLSSGDVPFSVRLQLECIGNPGSSSRCHPFDGDHIMGILGRRQMNPVKLSGQIFLTSQHSKRCRVDSSRSWGFSIKWAHYLPLLLWERCLLTVLLITNLMWDLGDNIKLKI